MNAPVPARILFVCAADFTGPSEKQVLRFASELAERGHAVAVSVAGDPDSVALEGSDRPASLQIWAHGFRGPRLAPAAVQAARQFRPTLIHAFSPRLPVVTATAAYAEASGAPVVVHFEDDEWSLAAAGRDHPVHRRLGRRIMRLASVGQPALFPFVTDGSLSWVRRNARALDALTPQLSAHVGQMLGRECNVVLPPLPGLQHPEHTTELRLPHDFDGKPLVAYTGRVFGVHLEDFVLALRAVAELQRRGHEVVFGHTGAAARRFDLPKLAAECGLAQGSAAFLGYRPAAEAHALMRRATVLVQPGAPTEFNRLRLPSKLPAYLASGTPTVTFAVGSGELFSDRREVLKTHTGDPTELADRIAELLEDAELAATLSREGPRAGARLFDPGRNTEALVAYYRSHL